MVDKTILHKAHDGSGNYQIKCKRCGCTAHVYKNVDGVPEKYNISEISSLIKKGKTISLMCPNCNEMSTIIGKGTIWNKVGEWFKKMF